MNEKYNPWSPITNSLDLKLLGKLVEELGECTAATSRCIIQGMLEKEPVTGKINVEWLEEELADVIANIELVIEHFNLEKDVIAGRVQDKQTRLSIWHSMPT